MNDGVETQRALPADINYRDEGLYSEDGFDYAVKPSESQREKDIREASAELQAAFPGRTELESDLRVVGPTPFILEKIRKVRSVTPDSRKDKI